jgi:serine/threonine protein kinase
MESAYTVLSGLSSTIYLLSILFRDLKVENVAKNPRSGAMQLFDFGLAKELKAKDKIGNDQYRLTGLTGTLRVMSPEVIQCVPYGSSADIYSFAIVAWEVFTGERNQLSAQDACKGLRPDCHGIQSSIETSLLQPCWRERPDLRPNATQICNLLAADLLALHQPNQDNIIHRVELLREISNENISELANS